MCWPEWGVVPGETWFLLPEGWGARPRTRTYARARTYAHKKPPLQSASSSSPPPHIPSLRLQVFLLVGWAPDRPPLLRLWLEASSLADLAAGPGQPGASEQHRVGFVFSPPRGTGDSGAQHCPFGGDSLRSPLPRGILDAWCFERSPRAWAWAWGGVQLSCLWGERAGSRPEAKAEAPGMVDNDGARRPGRDSGPTAGAPVSLRCCQLPLRSLLTRHLCSPWGNTTSFCAVLKCARLPLSSSLIYELPSSASWQAA